MITGTVNPLREARIPLTVRGPGGHEEDIEAVIDTGFTGWLTLPPALIAAMGLTWRGRDSAILADGSASVFDVYDTIVVWDGQPRRVFVDAANTDALLGMSLLYGYDLRIQAVDGGRVTIEALPGAIP